MSKRTVEVHIVKSEDSYNWRYLAEIIAQKITKGDYNDDRQRKVSGTA